VGGVKRRRTSLPVDQNLQTKENGQLVMKIQSKTKKTHQWPKRRLRRLGPVDGRCTSLWHGSGSGNGGGGSGDRVVVVEVGGRVEGRRQRWQRRRLWWSVVSDELAQVRDFNNHMTPYTS
jgi:hypothetical protein